MTSLRHHWPRQIHEKPRKFSRNGVICTCLVPVFDDNNPRIVLEFIECKYKVKPNTSTSKFEEPVWGDFESIVSMPTYIPENSEIGTGHFKRDTGLMPMVTYIHIKDMDFYNKEKLRLQRKEKIKKLNNE